MTSECLEHFDSVVIYEAEVIWPELMADFAADRLKPTYRSSELVDLAERDAAEKLLDMI